MRRWMVLAAAIMLTSACSSVTMGAGSPRQDQVSGTPATEVPKWSTPSGSVDEQWDRIEGWVAANLPDAQITGADDAAIGRAVLSTGVDWPPELIALYKRIDGVPRDGSVSLLPLHAFLSLDELLGDREMDMEIWAGMDREMGVEEEDARLAGQTAWTFRPEFLPFAGIDGYFLFIDTRPGELYGSVTEFSKTDADSGGPLWGSLSAMLTDLADSLETGAEFDGLMRPVVADGQLEWHYD